jgi:hypothetical protein
MIPRTIELLPGDPVGIVKPDQAFTVRPVQRQRVIQSMWLFSRHRHARYHEPDPVATLRIDHEHLAIEFKKCVQARVVGAQSQHKVITLR